MQNRPGNYSEEPDEQQFGQLLPRSELSDHLQSNHPSPLQQQALKLDYKLRENDTHHSDKVLYEKDQVDGLHLRTNSDDFGSGVQCNKQIDNFQSRQCSSKLLTSQTQISSCSNNQVLTPNVQNNTLMLMEPNNSSQTYIQNQLQTEKDVNSRYDGIIDLTSLQTNEQEIQELSQIKTYSSSSLSSVQSTSLNAISVHSDLNNYEVIKAGQYLTQNHTYAQEESIIADGIYDLLKTIKNPDDLSQTFEEAGILHRSFIISNENDPLLKEFGCPITIQVYFKPLDIFQMNAHLIGLAIRAKLNIILPKNQFKLDVNVLDNTHVNKNAIDRQINDKERLASTFEKESIWHAITQLIA